MLIATLGASYLSYQLDRQEKIKREISRKEQIALEIYNQIIAGAVDTIAKFEGFRSKPYKCAKGQLTIGYGDGRSLNKTNIHKLQNIQITERVAKEALTERIRILYEELDNSLFIYNSTLTPNQKIAIISIADNMGIIRFTNSSLFTLIKNKKDIKLIIREWLKFDKVKVAGQYKVIKGLSIRRKREVEIFNSK